MALACGEDLSLASSCGVGLPAILAIALIERFSLLAFARSADQTSVAT
jgi:hypothetical protein